MLEKAKAPPKGQESCYQKMKETADKYKRQSLNEAFSLRERLKAQDIVRCEDIQKVGTEKNLGDFALNMCYRAQEQKQAREEVQRAQESAQRQAEQAQQEVVQAGQEFQSKAQGAGSAVYQGQGMDFNEERAGSNAVTRQAENQPAEADKKSSSAGKALLGAGALAGTALGVKALTAGNSKTASQTDSATSTKPSAQKESPKPSVQKNTASLSAKKARPKQTKTRSSQASKAPSKQNIQVAQAVSPTGSCPVNMPSIRSAVVYQSVEAPQIEPMNQQENQLDPDNPYFTSYDLVMGKPAGILVDINEGSMNKSKDFVLAFNINGGNYHHECFHAPLKGEMTDGGEDVCVFEKSDFRSDGNLKFFPLPMKSNLQKEGSYDVKMVLYSNGQSGIPGCLKEKDFTINIIKTEGLKLGFVGVDSGQKCKSYQPTVSTLITNFVNSDEVKSYIPSMFPVLWSQSGEAGHIDGYCSNALAIGRGTGTVGLLKDIDTLEWRRYVKKYNKITAIVPSNYFLFHKVLDESGRPAVGTVILPKWKEWRWIWFFGKRWFKTGFLGGSWNVAFVADTEHEKGTIAHELAHTLGQGREFYEPSEMCKQFKGVPHSIPCNIYKIPRVLATFWGKNGQVWEFKRNMFSIVNNRGDITTQWIDRDSYQKIFLILSKIGAIVSRQTELYKEAKALNKAEKNSYHIIFSGFYHKEKNSFILPKFRRQETRKIYPSPLKIKSKKISFVTVQLKEKESLLKELNYPILSLKRRVFYRDGTSTVTPFPFSHVMLRFKLPKNHENKDLKFVILDSKGKRIYSTPIPKKWRKKKR